MARGVKLNGEKLRAARERLFMSQAELGAKLDPVMSDENIGRIERTPGGGGILSKRVPQLAAALKMSVEEFEREIIIGKDEPNILHSPASVEFAFEVLSVKFGKSREEIESMFGVRRQAASKYKKKK